jgi:predicted nucleic-acid-binding protein
MMALLDTNVLIRFLTSYETQKFRGVYTLFESLEQGDLRVELKLIVLFQVVFVLKSFYSVPREEIATGFIHGPNLSSTT